MALFRVSKQVRKRENRKIYFKELQNGLKGLNEHPHALYWPAPDLARLDGGSEHE